MKIVEQSVELIDYMGNDDAVADAARVSFHKEAGNYTPEQNQKLISYLAKHNHWTPFAHCFLKFRIKAPVFVGRQLVKHQVGLVWNEVSRRYVDDEPEFFQLKWRMRAENVKQGSSGEFSYEQQVEINDQFWHAVETCFKVYDWMLEIGVAPEQARAVLNLNHQTEWIWSGSIAAFARVCKLRLDPHAQAETREVAEKIAALVPEEFKYSWSALLDPVPTTS